MGKPQSKFEGITRSLDHVKDLQQHVGARHVNLSLSKNFKLGVPIENSKQSVPDSEMKSRSEPLGIVTSKSTKPAVQPKLFGAPEKLMALTFATELLPLPFVDLGPPTFLSAVFIGSCLSLPSMLAAWSCIRSGAWRYCLTVFVALLNGFIVSWIEAPSFDLFLVLLPLATTLPTLLTLFLIKRAFGRFAPSASDAEFFVEGLQFSLSHLFIVTTSLAVLLAVGKVIWPLLTFDSPPGLILIVSSLVALISFNTLLHVWALMGQQAILRACIAIPLGIVTLVACSWVCRQNGANDASIWYLLAGLPLLSSFVLMTVFRYGGWRFWKAAKQIV